MPDRNGSGIGVGLVGVVGKLGDRFRCDGGGTKIELMMVSRVAGGHLADIRRLVELTAVEGNRKGLELRAGLLARVVENRRRIDTATEPDSDRNVGSEMLFDRLCQELVELRSRVFESRKSAVIEWVCLPVAVRRDLSIVPGEKVSGQQLENASGQCVRSGDVVETKVSVQGVQVDAAADLRVAEDRLHLRAEVDVASAAGIVERLDSHAVAGQNQSLTGFAPHGEGKHSAQFFDAGCVPLHEGVKNDFGVAGGSESVTEPDKLVAAVRRGCRSRR